MESIITKIKLQYIAHFMFMLLTTIPVIEPIDWLFYSVTAISASCFLFIIIILLLRFIKDKTAFVNIRDRYLNQSVIYDFMICIIGFIIGYAEDNNLYKVWILGLAMTVLTMLTGSKKK